MNALQQFFEARPMAFALTLEGLSLLVIAPLTARFVNWQEARKWRPARQAIVADVVSDAFTLVGGTNLFFELVPKRNNYEEQTRQIFDRLMSIEPHAWYQFDADEQAFELKRLGTTPEAGDPAGLQPYEILRVESPSALLQRPRAATTSLTAIETAAARLEERIRHYGFCFSPEMVLIIAEMFSRRSGERAPRVRINPYGAGGAQTVFLREVSASARSLRRFVDNWVASVERLSDKRVRDALIRDLREATHFDLSVVAQQMAALLKHVRLEPQKHTGLLKKLNELQRPEADQGFRTAVDEFEALLVNFDQLQTNFDQMREQTRVRFTHTQL
jgi:hypothetical protein